MNVRTSIEGMKLQLQINNKPINDTSRPLEPVGILVTPPIDENFWLFRVPVSDNQAIVGFPKFLTIGIGFQHETDWNANLPYRCPAEEIFNHIKHNKGDRSIPDARCLQAIRMIQAAARKATKEGVR